MAHRVAPQASADPDDIRYYIAKESGSIEIADQLIDSITERFFCWLAIHTWDVPATTILALVCAAFPSANMSLFTLPETNMCSFFA